jgi:capsid protein
LTKPGPTSLRLAVEDKFNLISEASQCWLDEQRKLTLSGLVRLAVAGFVYTGEVIATAGWVREVGRPFNTTVQMIMPVRLCNPDGQADDDTLRRGVRRDSRGKAVGYYFRKSATRLCGPTRHSSDGSCGPHKNRGGDDRLFT